MLTLRNKVEYECKRCFRVGYLVQGGMPTPSVAEFERALGYEVEYTWAVPVSCAHCGNPITLSLIAYEYPRGAFNMSMPSITGARLVTEPEYMDDIDNSLTDVEPDTTMVQQARSNSGAG